jgi:hypothetical protein
LLGRLLSLSELLKRKLPDHLVLEEREAFRKEVSVRPSPN